MKISALPSFSISWLKEIWNTLQNLAHRISRLALQCFAKMQTHPVHEYEMGEFPSPHEQKAPQNTPSNPRNNRFANQLLIFNRLYDQIFFGSEEDPLGQEPPLSQKRGTHYLGAYSVFLQEVGFQTQPTLPEESFQLKKQSVSSQYKYWVQQLLRNRLSKETLSEKLKPYEYVFEQEFLSMQCQEKWKNFYDKFKKKLTLLVEAKEYSTASKEDPTALDPTALDPKVEELLDQMVTELFSDLKPALEPAPAPAPAPEVEVENFLKSYSLPPN